MPTHVACERRDDIGYLTLSCDEPGKPITLSLAVLDQMEACLDEIESQSESLRAVVLQSDSPKYFCVGANIEALKTLNAETIIPWVQRGHAVFSRLAALPLPVIAFVTGYALGGGLELALACDLIIATEDAKLGQPEATLGLVAGWGGSYRLPRRVGLAQAKFLFFSGSVIDARAAKKNGLVDFVGSAEQITAHLQALLEGIRRCSPLAVAQMKRLIDQSPAITVEESAYQEAVASSTCMASADTQGRIKAFLEKRKA